jgi:5-methylcytosine-specific restriction endonuclease McrA
MDTSIPQKYCTKCEQFKPLTSEFFPRDGHRKDGFNLCRKDCINKYHRDRRIRKTPENFPLGHKRCTQCKLIFPIENFSKSKRGLYGVTSWCKECIKNYDLMRKTQKVEPPPTLTCVECGINKPATLEYFGKNSYSPTGLYIKCKDCMNKYNRKLRRNNPNALAKERAKNARWRKENPERAVLSRKKQRATEHYKQHSRAYARQYRRERAEYYREKHRAWRETEQYQAYRSRYFQREDVKIRVRIASHIRRARYLAAPGRYTAQDIQHKLQAQKSKCYYCQKHLEQYHIDHVIPLSRGGTNWPDNLVLACPTCNYRKHVKLPHEWPEGGRLF